MFRRGLFGILVLNGAALFRQRPDQHDHLAAFHLGEVLHAACVFGVFGDTLQQLAAQVLVRHFAAPETQGDFDLVAVLKKLEDIAHLDFIVVRIRVRTELDLFDLDDLLRLAGFGFAFLRFVFEFAEIHDLADGRIGVWRNFHQIKPGLFGHFHSARRRNNADILAISANQANFI